MFYTGDQVLLLKVLSPREKYIIDNSECWNEVILGKLTLWWDFYVTCTGHICRNTGHS
jgi:hypothetical protein